MPQARDIQLADAIVKRLNQEPFNGQIFPTREYVTSWDSAKELQNLQCAVIPLQRRIETGDRRRPREVVRLLVCFGQRLNQHLTSYELDTLMNLTEAAIDSLERVTVNNQAETLEWSNRLWEDLLRFDPDELEREIVNGQTVYTGTFLSAHVLEFVLLT